MSEIVTPEYSPQKKLDVNKYATKKTIAQGMLDIALLTANASQLKYILQVGRKHEFYTLMLGLIITSLILQVFVGILLLSLNFMRDCRLHLVEYKTSATYINHLTTGISIAISAINLLISAFDPTLARFVSSVDANTNSISNNEVTVAVLNLVLSRMDIRNQENESLSTVINHIATGCALLAMVSDVMKMSFGLDPALSLKDYYRVDDDSH